MVASSGPISPRVSGRSGSLGPVGPGQGKGSLPKFQHVKVLGNIDLVGGKAAGILRLEQYRGGLKFLIPETIAIAGDFFKIPPQPLTNPQPIMSLPPKEIAQLFAAIKSSKIKGPIAIRSSSPVEDMAGSVAAGVFETKFHGTALDSKESQDRFIEKLLAVLNSAYAPKTHQYWKKQGFDQIPELPVMIQEVAGETKGHYFLPATAGIINTSLNKITKVSTVLGLGTAAVDRAGLGLLHNVPRLWNINPADVSQEGALNVFNISCIDLQTGNLVRLKGRAAQKLLPDNHVFDLQRRFPGQQIKVAQIATDLERSINHANSTNHAFDLEWVSTDGQNITLVQIRPIKKRIVRQKPKGIPSEKMILDSQHLMGYGRKDFIRHVIYVKQPEGIPNIETIQALTNAYKKLGNILIIFDTHVRLCLTSDEVAKNILPFANAVIVIDRYADGHKSGTGLQHFSLNVAAENKIFVYADNDRFMERIRALSEITVSTDLGKDTGADITVYEFEDPLSLMADDEAEWALLFEGY